MSPSEKQPARHTRAPLTRRHVTALGALAAVSLALSACGGSTSSATTASGAATPESTVSFFSWDTQETMQPVIDGFEKANPGIKVEFNFAPPVGEYISTLQTRLRSKTAADVFIITAENKQDLMSKKLVKDLSSEPFMVNIAPAAKNTYTKEGATYGVAVASWGGGILYNRALFTKAGLTSEPKTWDEFLADCQKLKAAGITPFLEPGDGIPVSLAALLGLKNASLNGDMDAQIWAGKQNFASTWSEPLTTWSELFTKGIESKAVAGLKFDQVMKEFSQGKTAMVTTGSWALGSIRESAPNIDMSFAPVPGTDGTPYWAGAVSPGYAINAAAKHPVAAQKFVEYLQSKEGVQLYQKKTSAITTTADFTPTLDPALAEMVAAVRDGKFYLPQVWWVSHSDQLNTEAVAQLQELMAGSATPQQVAAALDAKRASLGS